MAPLETSPQQDMRGLRPCQAQGLDRDILSFGERPSDTEDPNDPQDIA